MRAFEIDVHIKANDGYYFHVKSFSVAAENYSDAIKQVEFLMTFATITNAIVTYMTIKEIQK